MNLGVLYNVPNGIHQREREQKLSLPQSGQFEILRFGISNKASIFCLSLHRVRLLSTHRYCWMIIA